MNPLEDPFENIGKTPFESIQWKTTFESIGKPRSSIFIHQTSHFPAPPTFVFEICFEVLNLFETPETSLFNFPSLSPSENRATRQKQNPKLQPVPTNCRLPPIKLESTNTCVARLQTKMFRTRPTHNQTDRRTLIFERHQ